MNADLERIFDSHVRSAVAPLTASTRRKRTMHQELLAHLVDTYEEELRRLGDEQAAADAALARFGNPIDLRKQLQNSVPLLERCFFLLSGRKEAVMSRILWITGSVIALAAIITFLITQPLEFGPVLMVLAVFALLGWIRSRQLARHTASEPRRNPHWHWLSAIAAIFFGTAIILPALAHLQQFGPNPTHFSLITLGTLIVVAALAIIISAMIRSRPQTA